MRPYGLLVTNGEFVADKGEDPTQVEVLPSNQGVVRFVNGDFWGRCNQIAKIEGTGTVGFTDCTFDDWSAQGDRAAIQAISGTVLVRGCDFHRKKRQIELGKAVDRAVITDNLLAGPAQIQNLSTKDVQIGHNAASS